MKNTYIVYIIRNKINSKVYIGQTKQKLHVRFAGHIRAAKYQYQTTKLSKAMHELGVDNFYIEVLCVCKNRKDMSEKELDAIYAYNSHIEEYGYNTYHREQLYPIMTPEVNKKISEGRKEFFENISNKEKEEWKSKIRLGVQSRQNKDKEIIGVETSQYGKFRTRIKYKGIKYNKSFNELQEAREAYDKMILYLYKDNSVKLNFPNLLQEYLREDLENFFIFFNTRKIPTSQYKGVYLDRRGNYYIAKFKVNKKKYCFGYYKNEIDAAQAYDQGVYLITHSKENLNFPNKPFDVNYDTLEEFLNFVKSNGLRSKIKKSKYRGVSVNKWGFVAHMPSFKQKNGKGFCKQFRDEIDAAICIDILELLSKKTNKRYNFPEKVNEYSKYENINEYITETMAKYPPKQKPVKVQDLQSTSF